MAPPRKRAHAKKLTQFLSQALSSSDLKSNFNKKYLKTPLIIFNLNIFNKKHIENLSKVKKALGF